MKKMGDRSVDLDHLERKLIEFAGELSASLSINPLVGQIYALLYFSPEPLSQEEIREKLGISKGSVSMNLRVLEDWNAVHRVWIKGSRRDHYIAESDITKVVLTRVREGLQKRLSRAATMMEEVNQLLRDIQKNGKMSADKLNFYGRKIKQLDKLRSRAEKILKILPTLKGLLK